MSDRDQDPIPTPAARSPQPADGDEPDRRAGRRMVTPGCQSTPER